MTRFQGMAWSLVFSLVLAGNLPAEQTAKAVPALTPEVQTAQWAVKWWMPRHEQKLKELSERQGQVDLLWIGDSITHGWENGGKKVWEEFYAGRKAFNIGFSGDRTEQVLWRLQHGEVEGIRPKLTVIMIGTNNTGHRKDPADQTAAGIQAILKELETRLPETKILLLAIFPRAEKPDHGDRKLNDAINKIISGYDDGKRVHFLNIGPKFLTEDGTLTKDIMPDLLHPNEKGYRLWAESIEPKVKELLGE